MKDIVYIIIMLLILLISIPIEILGKYNIYSKLCLILIIVVLSLFSGLQYGVGTDFWDYKHMFDMALEGLAPDDIEKIFYMLNVFIRNFTDKSEVFFVITSIIINACIVITIYNKSPNFMLSVFLYISMGFYITSFNILRQFMSVAIMFFIINCGQRTNALKILIAVLIGIGFHNTSIIVIFLIVFFLFKNIDIRKLIIIFIIISLASFIIEPLITNSLLTGKYEDYGDTNFFSYGTSIIYVIEYFLILFFYYIYHENIKEDKKFYLFAICIGLIFITLGYRGVLYNRMALSFNLYNTLLLPEILKNIDFPKEKRVLYYMIYLVFFLKFILLLQSTVPYTTNVNIFY